jgi:hypothetical protein
MTTGFPATKDEFINPNSFDALSAPSHSEQHSHANDAIRALEDVVGVTNSEDSNSLTYKVNELGTAVSSIGNTSDTTLVLLGLDGNNDLEVTNLENKTVIDSFASSAFRSADYSIQITRGQYHEAFKMKALQDGSNIYVTTSDVISNIDSSLANVTFEQNSGIINLCVTPTGSPVSVRFIRTALKN